jgi:hypothetical protein
MLNRQTLDKSHWKKRLRIRNVFGPPGSFHHQAKIVRKTLIPAILWLLYDFLSLKSDVMYFQKVISQKFRRKKIIFFDFLKVTVENSRIRIRIHWSKVGPPRTKIPWIRNIGAFTWIVYCRTADTETSKALLECYFLFISFNKVRYDWKHKCRLISYYIIYIVTYWTFLISLMSLEWRYHLLCWSD